MGLSARRVASFEYLAARAVSASDAEPGAQPPPAAYTALPALGGNFAEPPGWFQVQR
jgi:hypothetical protein